MQTLRIILADDHELVRGSIKRVLETESRFSIVGEASNGHEAISKSLQLKPDIIVLDIDMPLLNGLEAARIIREESPSLPILMLSMHSGSEYALQSKLCGASGYLPKTADLREFINAIFTVVNGNEYFAHLVEENGSPPVKESLNNTLFTLTPREKEIMRLISDGHSTKAIAAKLFISHKTVENHRSNLLRKSNSRNMIELVKYLVKNNLLN